ncbi:glycoside hydrolase family 32 protein [Botrimarina mediterranea]|uniref:Levanase n=1 Tax=Botrimarina mediterranea TaxID=2528022 RepID=A0A518K844_9BACT|nr:glycoside hydrolase family 32 protein [Botrimarina mediterranea]QDV73959.1 Levanase precursor [Botrimarina mediterranea]QDV78589.1 Levanase precursor [Planctomycetes bacterium K2D]
MSIVCRVAAVLCLSVVAPAASPLVENSDIESGDLAPREAGGDALVTSSEPISDTTKAFAFDPAIKAEAYADIDYREPLRPQFHFSSGRNWLNDPNGMVHDGEKYHLFFQHNPAAPVWGNMTWGHAVSTDMVHWKQQPHALLPYRVDGRAGTIYSGTAIVDHNNSLGVQQGSQKTLCAFYTFATEPKFYQAMAYSTDSGESWTYWNEGRAVVPHQGFDNGERDPKVFWHEPSRRWVMSLWVQSNPGRVRFFTSENLTDWEFASDLMRDWAFECMDMVFYPGADGEQQAVIYDASFDYEVGTFDGKEFHTEAGPFVAGGGNFYAAQTFNNSPDERVVQIGWMRGGPNPAETHGLPFNQQMSFPCELTLRDMNGEPRLFAWPIEEIATLVEETREQGRVAVDEDGADLLNGGVLDLADIELAFEPGDAETIHFDLGKARLWYKSGSRELWMSGVDDKGDRTDVLVFRNLKPRDGVVKLRLLIDRLSVEAFAFGGEQFFAGYYLPLEQDGGAVVRASSGGAAIRSAEVRRLRSAWRP